MLKKYSILKWTCLVVVVFLGNVAHANATLAQADVNNLSVYLSQIIRPNQSPSQYRNHKNIEELIRVSAWLKNQMEKFGIPCSYQSYAVANQAGNQNYRNVVCKLNVGASKQVILGAHYDVHEETHGADDNASGVAGVLEAARILAAQRRSLNQNVEFVFYTLEEPPYFRTEQMGSAVHAKSVLTQKDQISGVYILEMIGYFNRKHIQEYPSGLKWLYPSHGNFIAAVSNLNSRQLGNDYCDAMQSLKRLDCQKLVAPSFVTGIDFSDHLNYWKYDIPALMITDTAFFRNKNYHTANDTIDTLNLNKMKDVIDGVVTTILQLKSN